jgi:RNA polymerase sigma-70 factor (ECF subfamily)
MSDLSSEQITNLLTRWGQGDEGAMEQLTPLVYGDLRKLASWLLQGERPHHTLQPTALVNEAYLRLAGDRKIKWQNRAHFFAVASRVMRHILIDYARQHNRSKRGGGAEILPLEEALVFTPEVSSSLLALNDALQRLGETDERKARIVELRYFGGLTAEETGEVLHISPHTVVRDWVLAKAWLRREIQGTNNGPRKEMEAG